MTDNKDKQHKLKKPVITHRVNTSNEYKLNVNGSYDVFIKKLEEKLDILGNNNEYLNVVWDQTIKKQLNANVFDDSITPLPTLTMPLEVSIAEKNPIEAINRQVLTNRRNQGLVGRELNAATTPVEELDAIQMIELAKNAYQTAANALEVEKLKLRSSIDRAEKFKLCFDKNLKVISATITSTLADNLIKVLATTANYHDTMIDGMLTAPSFTRNPITYLERVNAILLGLGSRSITETTSNELRFKARRIFDNAAQAASEDLRSYIIRFDSTVSNLKKVYGTSYESSFNELEIVQRFLHSLHDKSAYTHYSNAAIFGTASWPETYQDAKLKVLESLDERRSRSDRATGLIFNTLPSKKKVVKNITVTDKATPSTAAGSKKKVVFNNKSVNTTDKATKEKAEGCWICGSNDHMCRYCPDRKTDFEQNLFSFIYMLQEVGDEFSDSTLCLIFDSGATKSIYGNVELMNEQIVLDEPTIVRTINGTTRIDQKGTCAITGIEALYSAENGNINIIAMNDLLALGLNIIYDNEHDRFVVMNDNAIIIQFDKSKGLYCAYIYMSDALASTCDDHVHDEANNSMVKAYLSNDEREAEAYGLIKRMSVSENQSLAMLRGNVLKDVPFDASAIKSALSKFGVDPAYVRGRLKRLNKNIKLLKEIPNINERLVVGSIDIMYAMQKEAYFVAYLSKEKLTFINFITDNRKPTLIECVRKLKDTLATKGWKLVKLFSDQEGGFDVEECLGLGIELVKVTTHLGDIDAVIKIIKERARSIIAANQYPVPRKLLRFLFAYCVLINNILPQWIEDVYISPREFFVGRKASFLDFTIGFGQYIEVLTDYEKHNDMYPRSMPAIALLPKLDDAHSWVVVMINSGVVRVTANYNAKVVMNDTVRTAVNNMDGTLIADELEVVGSNAVHHIFHVTYKKATTLFGKKSADEAALKEISDLLAMETWKPVDWGTFANLSCFVFFREKLDAAGNRIKIKARCVITKLQSAKVKAHHLKLYDTINTSSPTPSWEVISCVLGIAASKSLHCITIDIPFSFIWAENPNNHIMVLDEYTTGIVLKLKPEWTSLAVPGKNGQKLKVKLLRNQYGLEEASLLWHELFSAFLINVLEFKRNKFHKCVFTKVVENEEHITAVLYVDDLLLSGATKQSMDMVIDMIKENFGNVHTSNYDEFDYLGVHVKMNNETKSAELSCDDYVRRIISHDLFANDKNMKMYKTPASSNLFEINQDSDPLSVELKEKFHSIVAKILWISLRVRLDVLMPIAYMASKVHQPTNHELAKLKRLVGYLKFRPKVMLKLNAESLIRDGVIHAYCDAAHAVHKPSMKSHLGCFISLGCGPVALKSVGAKRMSNSSTNSEIYAFSLIISMLQGIANFLSSFGMEVRSICIHEDNEAVIKIILGDKPLAEGSRHMEIHRLFIKEELELMPDAKVVWCESEEMIADILTKALQGLQFEKLVLKMGIRPVGDQNA